MTLRALTTFDYNGRRYRRGDLLDPASAGDGNVLTLAQLAVAVDDQEPQSRPSKKKRYKTRHLQAED